MNFEILKDIPMYHEWNKIEPFLKGWSDDKKFYIEDKNGKRFLLRLSDISGYENKKLEYDYVKRISKLDINISTPVDFGICSNGQTVFILYTWVDGKDAETDIPNRSEREQYKLGLEAGRSLKRIHSIQARPDQEEWEQRFCRKIKNKIRMYNECSIKIENDAYIIQFIEENMPYLKDRPQTFHHGDYHTGNLVICNDDKIGIIDFNRIDFGDPWEEFNRIIFSLKVSIPFSIGQIHGYFCNDVPDLFFRLMGLYIVSNGLSSVPWAIPYGEKEINYMLDGMRFVRDSYEGFKTYIPNWYKTPEQCTNWKE